MCACVCVFVCLCYVRIHNCFTEYIYSKSILSMFNKCSSQNQQLFFADMNRDVQVATFLVTGCFTLPQNSFLIPFFILRAICIIIMQPLSFALPAISLDPAMDAATASLTSRTPCCPAPVLTNFCSAGFCPIIRPRGPRIIDARIARRGLMSLAGSPVFFGNTRQRPESAFS